MEPRSYLLSPYRLPTHHQIMLEEQEMAAWLNGYLALWHPALLRDCTAPPEVASSYDHEVPQAGHLYMCPESPPLLLPEDWSSRVVAAKAIRLEALPERLQTFDQAKLALEKVGWQHRLDWFGLSEEVTAPFIALGLGFLTVQALFEAMYHDSLLDITGFWQDVHEALQRLPNGTPDEVTFPLRKAALKLQEAREQLYHVQIYWLNFALLDPDFDPTTLPSWLEQHGALNLIATGEMLEKVSQERPHSLELLKPYLDTEMEQTSLTLCGGVYRERDDALLPLESQLWNFRKAQIISQTLLGAPVTVFARQKSAYHPYLPGLLNQVGIRQALLLSFDQGVVPSYYAPVVNWPGPDGKEVTAFVRNPLLVHEVQSYFNLVYHLNEAITQEAAPTIPFLQRGQAALPFYWDLVRLHQLGPVLGHWSSLSQYFPDAMSGDYAGTASADEFVNDELEQRIDMHSRTPVSGFARHTLRRRGLDTAWSLAALLHVLSPFSEDQSEALHQLEALEDRIETQAADVLTGTAQNREGDLLSLPSFDAPPAMPDSIDPPALPLDASVNQEQEQWAQWLAQRIQLRSDTRPGYLLLNPCSFTRRVALEIPGLEGPLSVADPIKAAQFDEDAARLVVEVPAFGFAWLPRGADNAPPPRSRLKLADETMVRNEFFEADIDPTTGGLRAFRDPRTRVNRLGQQLVFHPGSSMRATDVQITHQGTALGEVVSQGVLLNEQEQVLAQFRQRFRAWLGRPLLELRIELYPVHPPRGYPWHAYYGCRFAWRDERAAMLRGMCGASWQTHHTRPVTSEFLEIRSGNRSTQLFPGGLPFHQRHGSRMLDVILIPSGEEATRFDLGLSLDRDQPVSLAQGMVTPVVMVATEKGPPPVGRSGWLGHVDAPNLMVSCLRPCSTPDGHRAILARWIECSGYAGASEWRFAQQPSRAVTLQSDETMQLELPFAEDAVLVEYSANEFVEVRFDFR